MSETVSSNDSLVSPEVKERSIMSFEQYRHMCDVACDDFRKIGIQEASSYEEVANDPRTIFTEIDGLQVPVLSPVEFEKMYHLDRCKEMTNREEIFLLSIPLELASSGIGVDTSELPDSYAVIVEEFVGVDEDLTGKKHQPPQFLQNLNTLDFKHPDLKDIPGHETAWMAGYRVAFEPKSSEHMPYYGEQLSPVLENAWRLVCAENGKPEVPGENAEGTFILSSNQLKEMPEVVDGLWSVSKTGFGEILGANHPVSMEFNRKFFDEQITAANTMTAVHYDGGRPVCFGFVGLSMENNDWLNTESSVFKDEFESAKENQRAYVHFFELISDGMRGMGFSTEILKSFFAIAEKSELTYDVFFESTNMSATYIPAIIEQEIARSPSVTGVENVQILGKLTYWALTSGGEKAG